MSSPLVVVRHVCPVSDDLAAAWPNRVPRSVRRSNPGHAGVRAPAHTPAVPTPTQVAGTDVRTRAFTVVAGTGTALTCRAS